jgi:hypothetical protein
MSWRSIVVVLLDEGLYRGTEACESLPAIKRNRLSLTALPHADIPRFDVSSVLYLYRDTIYRDAYVVRTANSN